MRRLIIFELRKLLKTKSFYICTIISSVLVILNALILKSVSDATGELYSAGSYIMKFSGNGMLTLIIGIFTAIFVTEDFSSGTIKNIYAKGYSRNVVYLAKYIVSTICSLLMLVLTLLTCAIISQVLFKGPAIENTICLQSVLLQMLLILAYNSLFFIISITVGKLGSSIAFTIVGPSIVSLSLTLIDSFLNTGKIKLCNYWLDNLLSSVQSTTFDNSTVISSIMISIIIIISSIIVGTRLHSLKEL